MPLLRAGVALAAVAMLAACGSVPAPPPPAGPSIVASTDVYSAVAKAVGGDDVQVTSLIRSAAADPHEYEATPADALAVSKATVFVYNGAGYDDFAPKLLDSAEGNRPAALDVSALSGLDTQDNEHVWYDLPTVKKLADRLAAELGKADPADAATFTANAAAFGTKIDGLTAKLAAIKATHDGRPIAITEPVPLYLTEAAGLRNATPEEFSEAAEQGTDPPAAVLGQTLALFTGKAVTALVANGQAESPSTEQVEQAAAAVGIPVVRVTETLPAGDGDYVSWQTQQIDALAKALG